MPEVARIEVPPPEPFVEGEEGAEARGAGYSLIAPRMATEPLLMEGPDGHIFSWTPTESAYGDDSGRLDYLAGSAPVSLAARGREARYERAFPASAEVHVAQPEGRKYWHVLYEPPRPPAPYLGTGVWFGVSGRVSGIPLTPGRHTKMESLGFQFLPVYAEDLMGERVQGWYEVSDTDQGQQLFICIPAEWLLDPNRVYPVKIDPSVIVTTNYNAKIRRLSTGALMVGLTSDSFSAYFSFDNGHTWTPATFTGDLPYAWWEVDDQDRLWSAYVRPDPGWTGSAVRIQWHKIEGTTITYQGGVTSDSMTDNISNTRVCGVGVQGNYFYVYWSHYKENSNGTWDVYVFFVQATVPGSRFPSVSSPSRRAFGSYPDQILTSSKREIAAISVTSGGTVYALVSCNSYSKSRIYTGTSSTGYELGTLYQDPLGINGLSAGWWLDRNSKNLLTTTNGQTVTAISVPGITYPKTAVYLPSVNAIAVIGLNNSNQVVMRWYYLSTGSWGNLITKSDIVARRTSDRPNYDLGTIFAVANPDDGIPIIYKDPSQNILYSERLFPNTPPQAPTNLTRTAFDARNDAIFSWRHNDPDGDAQTRYQLQILLNGQVVYDTGAVQSSTTAHTLPGGTLENGHTYQWRVRTADQQNEWSPWSSYAVFQTGETPVVTILYPTAGTVINVGEVTVQWSTADQGSARVRLYDATGQNVLQEHTVDTPMARAKTLSGLANNTSYQVGVQVTSAAGITGAEALSGVFSVQFTPPPKPSATAVGHDGFVRISVVNPPPTGDQPDVASNELWRREPGKDWVRVAAGIAPDGTYDDYAVGSGVVYEYRARAVGANGTYTDSDPVSAAVTFDEWRFSPVDGQPEIRFRFDSSVTWRPEEDVQVPRTMSRYQRTYRNPSYPRVATIQARFRDGEDGLTVREQRERLLRYIEQGVVGWLRGPHGDCWRGVLLEPEVLPSTHFARETVTCVFRETREAP